MYILFFSHQKFNYNWIFHQQPILYYFFFSSLICQGKNIHKYLWVIYYFFFILLRYSLSKWQSWFFLLLNNEMNCIKIDQLDFSESWILNKYCANFFYFYRIKAMNKYGSNYFYNGILKFKISWMNRSVKLRSVHFEILKTVKFWTKLFLYENSHSRFCKVPILINLMQLNLNLWIMNNLVMCHLSYEYLN